MKMSFLTTLQLLWFEGSPLIETQDWLHELKNRGRMRGAHRDAPDPQACGYCFATVPVCYTAFICIPCPKLQAYQNQVQTRRAAHRLWSRVSEIKA